MQTQWAAEWQIHTQMHRLNKEEAKKKRQKQEQWKYISGCVWRQLMDELCSRSAPLRSFALFSAPHPLFSSPHPVHDSHAFVVGYWRNSVWNSVSKRSAICRASGEYIALTCTHSQIHSHTVGARKFTDTD